MIEQKHELTFSIKSAHVCHFNIIEPPAANVVKLFLFVSNNQEK
jgi:hypothetical protein